jgi:hypothetical protein
MHQIARFPDDDGPAARLGIPFPIAIPMHAQIGGDQPDLLPVAGPQQKRIAHAFFTHSAHQHRIVSIQRLPLPAVLTDAHVNLLGHRGGLVPERREQKSPLGGQRADERQDQKWWNQ